MDMKPNTPLWKEKGMSYRARLFARLGFILAFVLLLCPGVPFAYIIFTPSRKTGNFWDDTFPIILTLGIIGGAIFALIKLRSSWNAPIDFKSSYGQIDSNKPGKPFEVWYQETDLASPFGKGTIAFQESEVILEGHRFRGTIYSLLNNWQGEEVSTKVPYSNVASVSVKGRYIIFKVETGFFPQTTIAFYVSPTDSEHMYRELRQHFPFTLPNP